jgi:hypothetical protein
MRSRIRDAIDLFPPTRAGKEKRLGPGRRRDRLPAPDGPLLANTTRYARRRCRGRCHSFGRRSEPRLPRGEPRADSRPLFAGNRRMAARQSRDVSEGHRSQKGNVADKNGRRSRRCDGRGIGLCRLTTTASFRSHPLGDGQCSGFFGDRCCLCREAADSAGVPRRCCGAGRPARVVDLRPRPSPVAAQGYRAGDFECWSWVGGSTFQRRCRTRVDVDSLAEWSIEGARPRSTARTMVRTKNGDSVGTSSRPNGAVEAQQAEATAKTAAQHRRRHLASGCQRDGAQGGQGVERRAKRKNERYDEGRLRARRFPRPALAKVDAGFRQSCQGQ